MAEPTPEEVRAGQAVYSPAALRLYDGLVHGLSNPIVWRCPTHRLLALYNEFVTGNHLDVGVGTGYFLDRCRFPVRRPRLALFDLNRNCLEATARRVRRYRPVTVRGSILAPLPTFDPPFDSVGLTYVLHCLPGRMRDKARVFDHLKPLLNPGGVLFGATLLSQGVPVGLLARRLMQGYNARGIFSNRDDHLDDLKAILEERFAETRVTVFGCAALFMARRPRDASARRPRGGAEAWG